MSDRTASRLTVLSTVTGSREVNPERVRGVRDAVLTVFSIPFEPTDCCAAGKSRPEQQDKYVASVDDAVEEGIP
jgi:hypothetical protein